MKDSDLISWLIQHYGREQYHPGLDRIRGALKDLLPSLKKSRVITIAGTNGKGETTLRLSQLLKGHSQCVWISPHIERITERFRDERGEINLDLLQSLINSCHQKVQEEGYQLSFYEFLFFVFCHWAMERGPEFLLLEVGLGGRLDAVNVLDAELVLLPSISRDHQEFLGNRYDLILAEKLGVMRADSTLISGLSLNYLRERAQAHCDHLGARMIDLEELRSLPPFDFSSRNQFLSYAAYLWLEGKSLEGLNEWQAESFGLEHRGECVKSGAEWLLYGSHNVDGMRKLIQFLHSGTYNFSRPPFDDVIVAFSIRNPHDLKIMLRMLKGAGLGPVTVTTFTHPKAAAATLMEELSRQEGLNFVRDIDNYVHGKNQGLVLIAGSYYFLGHLKSLLRRKPTASAGR